MSLYCLTSARQPLIDYTQLPANNYRAWRTRHLLYHKYLTFLLRKETETPWHCLQPPNHVTIDTYWSSSRGCRVCRRQSKYFHWTEQTCCWVLQCFPQSNRYIYKTGRMTGEICLVDWNLKWQKTNQGIIPVEFLSEPHGNSRIRQPRANAKKMPGLWVPLEASIKHVSSPRRNWYTSIRLF